MGDIEIGKKQDWCPVTVSAIPGRLCYWYYRKAPGTDPVAWAKVVEFRYSEKKSELWNAQGKQEMQMVAVVEIHDVYTQKLHRRNGIAERIVRSIQSVPFINAAVTSYRDSKEGGRALMAKCGFSRDSLLPDWLIWSREGTNGLGLARAHLARGAEPNKEKE